MTQFFVHLILRADGPCDFAANELAVTLAQAVDSHARCSFGDTELAGGGGVVDFSASARQQRSENVGPGSLFLAGQVVLKAAQDILEQGERPVAFVQGVGRCGVRGFPGKSGFRGFFIQRDDSLMTTAFLA